MRFGDDLITETFEEYAVIPEAGMFIECDDLLEAQTIAANFGTEVQVQRWFTTGWEPLDS